VPESGSLSASLTQLERTTPLSSVRPLLVNITTALRLAVAALPPSAPIEASLLAYNRSKAVLPPLIDAALAAIVRYDTYGDNSDMGALAAVSVELAVLQSNVTSYPDDAPYRAALASIEDELHAMPPVQPDVASLEALHAALGAVPPIPPRLLILDALTAAAAAVPDVALLSARWDQLNASLAALPPLPDAAASMAQLQALQALLPEPPTELINGSSALAATLAGIPPLVASSKALVVSTRDETLAHISLLELGFLGETQPVSTTLEELRATFNTGWLTALSTTFAIPVMCAGVSVAAAILQIGRPALLAGQAMITLLPWVWLEALGAEMPAAIMLQDGCAQLEDFILLVLSEDERPQYQAIIEPARSYMTNCAQADAMVDTYAPISQATDKVRVDVNELLAGLSLRPGMQGAADRLDSAAADILVLLGTANQAMDCPSVYALYLEAKASICCDFAYGVTVVAVGRLISAFTLAPAAVAAIAGYKRFRRFLWGPYATIQALEVGAYL